MISRPINIKIKDDGEKIFYDFLNENFNDEFILYHNYEVKGKEFDFFFIHKELGLFLFEVKKWSGYEIIEVCDNSKIKFRDDKLVIEEYEINPLKQARGYKFNILNKVKEKYGFEPRIIHVAVYPNMNISTFENKKMETYTERIRCILREDLLSKERFIERLEEIKSIDNYKNEILTDSEFLNIRLLFENIDKNIIKEDIKEKYIVNGGLNNKIYSIFTFLKSEDCTDEKLLNLIKVWKNGAKVYLCSDNKEVLDKFRKYVNDNLSFLEKYKQFKIYDSENNKYYDNIFNLSMYLYRLNNINKSFHILDGNVGEYKDVLQQIDDYTNFNNNQFLLEHYECNKDIIVEAGAGTGKTYSMISRITYLIYKHKYTSDKLLDKIAMITFTNEAANNMKKRLKEYYQNYYLLTRNVEALELVEGIDNINISTIHSLSKSIIDKFSHLIGLGANATIYNGKYEVDKLIDKHLNQYKNFNYESEDMIEDIQYRIFMFAEVIRLLLEKLEQKNIRLKSGYVLDDGLDKKCEIINEILPKIQKELIEESINENKVKLSHIMILILDILDTESDYIKQTLNLDYLFIDEFQDTDDVQIEIVKRFKEIVGFNLLVVGDIKQCIYRFRGADESAFKKLRGEYSNNFKTFELIKNYRTDKKILEDLNDIFEKWGSYGYINYESRLKGIKNLNNGIKQIEEIKYDKSNFSNKLIEVLKKEIELMERNNKKGKIAILVRTNKEVEKIRNIGKDNGIKIKADIGNNLFETVAAKDLYKLAIALKFNLDPKCLFGLFNTNYVLKNYDKKSLIKIRGNREKQLKYFNEINTIEKWEQYIEGIKREPVMKVIREIISDLEPWNIYACKDDDEIERKRNAIIYKRNLEQLIEWIIQTSNNEYLTINKLVSKLEIAIFTKMQLESRAEMLDSGIDEIEILCATIHKTKGLEYDVVMMPYCNINKNQKRDVGRVEVLIDEATKKIGYSFIDDEKIGGKFKRINNFTYKKFQKDEQRLKLNEEVRILYVALTRAISRIVYFSDNASKKNKEEIRWQDFINMN
ncbi:UvrD-helicase domain-containing protein [Clostridium baratii]|uniref:UvrD-helicase domain-containing protein n=1 Tax=Clostridium baratii TaxID=1561 RepID=UPI0030CBB0ED